MNETIKSIKERRSIRSYQSTPVPQHLLDQVLEAGTFAANGRNWQSCKIICITNPDLRNEVSKLNCKIGGWDESFDPFYGAPCILLVIADKSRPTYIYDGSLVMGNLMLAAHSVGLSSCWIHRAKEEMESEFGHNLLAKLGIEGEWEGIGHCALGYAAVEHPQAPARKEGWIHEIK